MNSSAQTEAVQAMYLFNGLFLDPASAGAEGHFGAMLVHRDQWSGIEGAPRTSSLAMQGTLLEEQVGLGFVLAQDRIGANDRIELQSNFAYHIKLHDDRKLSFGMRVNSALSTLRSSDLILWDANDPAFENAGLEHFDLDFGTGIMWSSDRSFISFSLPRLIEAVGNENGMAEYGGVKRSVPMFVRAGKQLHLADRWELWPSLMASRSNNAVWRADLNLHLVYDKALWIGSSYRTNGVLVMLMQYQLHARLRAGYSSEIAAGRYDLPMSHELMLGLDLGKRLKRIVSPRMY